MCILPIIKETLKGCYISYTSLFNSKVDLIESLGKYLREFQMNQT